MNCKKCGAPLAPEQVICSNCDTDNSQVLNQQSINEFQSQNLQNNLSYNSQSQFNNQNDSNQYISQSQNLQNEYNASINNNLESNPTNNANKKNIVMIIGIIIFVILLIPITIGIFIVISTKQINSQISKARIDSFVEEYQMLKKQVRLNMAEESDVVCNDNCEDYYDVDNKKYFFEVIDKGEFYELNFEVNKDLYGDFEFTNESCSYLSDSICSENKITGKVYKD